MRVDVNGGQKILLRLRPVHAPDTFYDEEEILHTMLHEVRLRALTSVTNAHLLNGPR